MALSKTRERLKVVREARVRARVKLEREEHELCVKAVAAAERTAAEAQAALDDAVNRGANLRGQGRCCHLVDALAAKHHEFLTGAQGLDEC